MNTKWTWLLILSTLLALPALGQPKTVTVDCDKGETIADALTKKGEPLTIEISGICVENVTVRRDDVSFVGLDPNVDGIQAATNTEPFDAAVVVREARNISFVNLQFSGGNTAGLRIENARRNISADNCLFHNNGTWGVIAVGAVIGLDNATVVDNATSGSGGGMAVGEAGQIGCDTCTISDNPDASSGQALSARSGGILSIVGSTVDGSLQGVIAQNAAEVSVINSTLDAGSFAVIADDHSRVTVADTSVSGDFWANDKSFLSLFDVVQSTATFNFMSADSFLEISSSGAGTTSFAADVNFEGFSEGRNFGGTSFQNLVCNSGSDFSCSGGESKVSSSCSLCP